MKKALHLNHIRKDYRNGKLDFESVHADPIEQFKLWLDEAIQGNIEEPTAMLLATCGKDLQPSVRVVLLKGVDQSGFEFYTNYHSRKGKQIQENPQVAATFFWKELERQVRIEGIAEKLPAAESDRYFASRPDESRFGAAASPQSQVIPGREFLEIKISELKNLYKNDNLPRPEHWGGYKIKPARIEFWQGRENRLHDRIVFTKKANVWIIERLAP
jgi:pyridoxamine 5'-phosphate oxidase